MAASWRERRRRKIIGGILGVIILLLVAILIVVLTGGDGGEAALKAMEQAAATEDKKPTKTHPWAQKEQDAIDAVKNHRTSEGTRVASEIGDSNLRSSSIFEGFNKEDFQWTARWVTDRSLYWVRYGVEEHGVLVGPRWLVQLDDEGPHPKGNTDGVVAANTLATYIEEPSERRKIRRYISRADRVLQTITEHKKEGSVQLASSLLIYFLGRGHVAKNTEVLGWTIMPTRIESKGKVLYDAYFQWSEDGNPRIAHWQLDVKSGEIRPQNLLATEIIKGSESIEPENVIDIRPRKLNLNKSPSRERNPMLRSLRYVLDDARRIEAVGALLAAKSTNTEISYDGWRIEPQNCRDCDVMYKYSIGGKKAEVKWHVTSNGEIIPQNTIAMMADRALRLESDVDALVGEDDKQGKDKKEPSSDE